MILIPQCIDDWLMRSFTCPSCMEPVDAALLGNLYNQPCHEYDHNPHILSIHHDLINYNLDLFSVAYDN